MCLFCFHYDNYHIPIFLCLNLLLLYLYVHIFHILDCLDNYVSICMHVLPFHLLLYVSCRISSFQLASYIFFERCLFCTIWFIFSFSVTIKSFSSTILLLVSCKKYFLVFFNFLYTSANFFFTFSLFLIPFYVLANHLFSPFIFCSYFSIYLLFFITNPSLVVSNSFIPTSIPTTKYKLFHNLKETKQIKILLSAIFPFWPIIFIIKTCLYYSMKKVSFPKKDRYLFDNLHTYTCKWFLQFIYF